MSGNNDVCYIRMEDPSSHRMEIKPLVTCTDCGKTVCYDDPCSFICGECNKNTCVGCFVPCVDCGNPYCKKHANKCPC